ncbi:hypothetical protein BCR37DRAFT_211949 [Protomyces lactucae-debilis]|uniref:RRM domain-containing protein n=1 Tax=Protomyces lactucae-debilis TaxID=2754530 RepID=A0A1Y2FUA0_PROLT|nr:uncharacterized protein BCR37DRAFT_211949 [Protomyces lactucae-debilis]ORY86275.1 hypothetical protein BCR37DRAFT_211949 [Protomyces lactucae-debilis]
MPPKKNKGVKLSLAEFNVDQSTGTNWADEEMDMPVVPGFASAQPGFASSGGGGDRWGSGPGGPPRRDYGAGRSGGGGDDFGAGPDRGYGVRDPIPMPDRPPFTSHIGNLTFDVTEGEITDFFSNQGAKVKSVRLVRDRETDRPRGFGYVEYEDQESLKQALSLSGASLAGRDVRVTVADAPKGGMAGERDLDWGSARSRGPLPSSDRDRQSSYGGRPGGGYEARGGGYEAREPREMREPREPERDLDWSSARSRGPLPPAEREERFGGAGGRERRGYEPREPREGGERREFSEQKRDSGPDLDWSSTRRGPVAGDGGASAPTERRKLSLAPRSASTAEGAATPATASSPVASTKASPFGAARAVDTSAAERKAEEKRQAMLQEREAAQLARQEAAKKEKEKKPVDILRRTEALSLADGKSPASPASTAAKEAENVDVKAEAELAAIVKKEEAAPVAEDGWTVNKKK